MYLIKVPHWWDAKYACGIAIADHDGWWFVRKYYAGLNLWSTVVICWSADLELVGVLT